MIYLDSVVMTHLHPCLLRVKLLMYYWYYEIRLRLIVRKYHKLTTKRKALAAMNLTVFLKRQQALERLVNRDY